MKSKKHYLSVAITELSSVQTLVNNEIARFEHTMKILSLGTWLSEFYCNLEAAGGIKYIHETSLDETGLDKLVRLETRKIIHEYTTDVYLQMQNRSFAYPLSIDFYKKIIEMLSDLR
jgi:hypothetical protein